MPLDSEQKYVLRRFAFNTAGGLLTLGLLFSIPGFSFICTGLATRHDNQRFQDEAVLVPGTVLNLSSTDHNRGPCYLSYSYRDKFGTSHENRTNVSVEEWNSLSVGGAIPVLYLPSEPQRNRLNLADDQTHYRQAGTILPILAGLALFIGLCFFGAAWRFWRFMPNSPSA